MICVFFPSNQTNLKNWKKIQLKVPCLTEGYDHVGVKAGSTTMGRKRVGNIKGGWSSITAGSTWLRGNWAMKKTLVV